MRFPEFYTRQYVFSVSKQQHYNRSSSIVLLQYSENYCSRQCTGSRRHTELFLNTLYITIPCTLQYPLHYNTLYITILCTLQYPVPYNTLYLTIQNTVQFLLHGTTFCVTALAVARRM